jgi:hypothetical protein
VARDFRLIRRRFDVVDAEGELGVQPVDLQYPVGDPRRYGAGRNSTNDTAALQTAIDVVSALENRSVVDLDGQTYVTETLTFDARRIRIANGTLAAHADIPAGGAILLSLAGGGDTTVNQALLDGIYGSSVYSVRTAISGSLENVHLENLTLVGVEGTDLRGIWVTGFTRGCRIAGCYFVDLEDAVSSSTGRGRLNSTTTS